MRRWFFLLSGMGVWLSHFLGVYGIASIADVVQEADAPAARLIVVAFTLVCAGAAVAIGWAAARLARTTADGPDRFIYSASALAAAFALVAVLWQGLPAVIGH